MARWMVAVVSVVAARSAHAAPVQIAKAPPAFGCFGRSANDDTLACVIGAAGANVGGSTESVVFARAAGDSPATIALFTETSEVSPGPDELPTAVVAALTAALRGYTAIETTEPAIELSDGHASPAVTVGGLRLAVRATPAKAVDSAPTYRTVLTVARAGHAPQVLDDRTAPTSRLAVRTYPLGKATVVELIASVADEGTYGSSARIWVCGAGACRALAAPKP